MNPFHSQTTIEGLPPTFGVLHQTMANMFRQGCTHTAPSICLPNPGSAPYTARYNGWAYTNPNGNYQAPYTVVAYTNPIPLPGRLLGFLPKSTYHTAMWHNTLGQPEFGSFGYETPPQSPFRTQPIDKMLTRATVKLGADPNNLTNQSATILRVSFGIEPKG
jgi:hypothetical protein